MPAIRTGVVHVLSRRLFQISDIFYFVLVNSVDFASEESWKRTANAD